MSAKTFAQLQKEAIQLGAVNVRVRPKNWHKYGAGLYELQSSISIRVGDGSANRNKTIQGENLDEALASGIQYLLGLDRAVMIGLQNTNKPQMDFALYVNTPKGVQRHTATLTGASLVKAEMEPAAGSNKSSWNADVTAARKKLTGPTKKPSPTRREKEPIKKKVAKLPKKKTQEHEYEYGPGAHRAPPNPLAKRPAKRPAKDSGLFRIKTAAKAGAFSARLEYFGQTAKGNASRKFWQIAPWGKGDVTARWGKVGGTYQEQRVALGTALKRAEEKIKKGYVVVSVKKG